MAHQPFPRPRELTRRGRTTEPAAVLVLWLAGMLMSAAAWSQPAVPDLGGKLYRSAFSSGAGMLSHGDLAGVPEPLRSRLATYLARRAAFKSQYKGEPDTLAQMRADAKRRVLERAIVSLLDVPGIERAAVEFVAGAPIAGEWNGLHQGPLDEAAYAENLLKKDPESPLAPWLYVFIAERQRIVFEASENEKDQAAMAAAARKYRTFSSRARSVPDPVFPALMHDLERLPYLYIKSAGNPRDYDPDT